MYSNEQKQTLVLLEHGFKGDWDLITNHFNTQYKTNKNVDALKRIFQIWWHAGDLEPYLANTPLMEESLKDRKQLQKSRDTLRLIRKRGRHIDRADNAIEELSNALIEVFKENQYVYTTVEHKTKTEGLKNIGILQFSDAHFDEIINLKYNKYDFSIASARCKTYIEKAILYFKATGVEKVLFAMTGDLINSDRLYEEAMTNATNRAQAMFLAVEIISNMIKELNDNGFNVSVLSVAGNESRLEKDITFNKSIVSGNYDITINNMLKIVFKESKGVEFIDQDDPNEIVVCINGINILALHGHQKGFGIDPEKAIAKIVRRYANNGTIINFVIFGHMHQTLQSDLYARSSSLPGANAYSENALMLTSRAAQNLFVVSATGIDSVKVDLQNVDPDNCYNITKELEAYHAKSAEKDTTIYVPITV